MKIKKSVYIFICLWSMFFPVHYSLMAQDWPDWRGKNRDGVWTGDGIIEKFESPERKAIWTVPVGAGYSGPTVSNGRVYLTDRIEIPDPTEGVLCFDEDTGKKIWEYRYDCVYERVGYPAGPRASVVIAGNLAFSLGTMGHLHCFDAASGKLIWQKDLNKTYQINMPIWGIAATPLVHGNKLIIQAGGSNNACVIALNPENGEEIWRNLNDIASYSAPVIFEKNGHEVLVVWTVDHLAGLNPDTGNIYWKFPWKLKSGMGISTPVLYKDHIYVSCFYNGSLLVKLGNDYKSATKVWQRSGESERNTDALHTVISTPVILDDHIYGVDSYGELRCLDFYTGDRIWEDLSAVDKNRWANIHFVWNGEKIWMFNEHGQLIIAQLSPKGFSEISRTKIINPTKAQLPRGVTWAHPAFANGKVYVRNDEELRAVDLRIDR